MNPHLEYFPTPQPFSTWLHESLIFRGRLFEPCVGDGAIIRAIPDRGVSWVTNDLDPHWKADHHLDATQAKLWDAQGPIDWTITNPPFGCALEIAEHAIAHSRVGVAMHLRASIHEVLKEGPRRTWMTEHEPNGILWLPRFAYQRSKTKGMWSTDSVCACWVIWLNHTEQQFIKYAPETLLQALTAMTPAYRELLDRQMGFVGSEEMRQDMCRTHWKIHLAPKDLLT